MPKKESEVFDYNKKTEKSILILNFLVLSSRGFAVFQNMTEANQFSEPVVSSFGEKESALILKKLTKPKQELGLQRN